MNPGRLVVAALCTVFAVVGLGVPAAATAPPDSAPPAVGIAAENPFIPERDLGECISALPRPDCGSEAHGGWRQGLLFGLLAAGLVGIGARIAVGVRRRDRERNAPHAA